MLHLHLSNPQPAQICICSSYLMCKAQSSSPWPRKALPPCHVQDAAVSAITLLGIVEVLSCTAGPEGHSQRGEWSAER